MEEKSYSEKEISILTGMIDLIKNGANPYNIKVSDIALSAGVGKGTIYDYFGSKEEVISKAILFNIHNEIEIMMNRINLKNNLKDKYYEILNIIVENLENKFSTFNIFTTANRLPEFQLHKPQECFDFNCHILRLQGFIDDLLDCGFKEGEIIPNQSKYYGRMVINSSIFSFVNYMTMKDMYTDTSIKEAMDDAYKMLIKALN